ncbi:tRNA-splicing endonuclease subunit Sen34 [Leptidea sinapis]|uniref:tRNA-splicing endonuclease subunit Sen34 n=1 Tax=Leptidea sinapis TaxID=189913 RepID=UPI00212712B1|nr:tRNA-splicing endonuclease subunit Sen34 [Leptidea sinapis]
MIPLFLDCGVAYVWNSDDWYVLRTKYRICGSLIGSLPSHPRQNELQGLPLALMSEETSLLVNEGICELYHLPHLHECPLDELKQEIDEIDRRVLEDQKVCLKKKKIEQLTQKIDVIFAGKKQKLLSKGIIDVDLDKNELLQQEINKISDPSPEHLLIHLPTQHHIVTEKRRASLDALVPSVLDDVGVIKCAVFKDLWKKGYCITNGSKFGSDLLLYPGDPVKFHAGYMVRCISNQTSFYPKTIVAFGRLSVAVNKLAVLAFFNNINKIEYQTIQWHDSVNV